MPSDRRQFDPDTEFAKLDGPDVPTLETSLEHGAQRAIKEGNYSRALSLYQQLTDTNPKQPRYRFGMAEALRRLGEYKAALILYSDVTEKDPDHLEAFEGMALVKMAMGETEDAARILQGVLKKDRTRWRTLNALGILFATKEMYPESTAYLKEALKVSTNNPSVMNNLGLIEAMQKKTRSATQMLKEAARFGHDEQQREQIDMNRALIHGMNGEMDEAETIASQYLDGSALQNNLGLYAYLTNNRELAKGYLNMALSGTQTYYKRAWENLDIVSTKEDAGKKAPKRGKRVKVK